MIYQHKKLLNDLLFFFFALFVFGSTFSIAMAQVSLGLALITFIVAAIYLRYNPFVWELRWFYVFVGLYILWMIISALKGRTPLASIKILKEEWLFCAVPIGIYLLGQDNYRRYLVRIFAIGVGLFSLYGLIQMFTGVHWFKSVGPDPGPEFGYYVRGNFPSPMTFGNYFGTAAGFFAGYVVARWRQLDISGRTIFGMLAVIAILSTIGSYNRGALLGLLAAFVVLAVSLRRWKLLAAGLTVLVVALAAIASSATIRDRLHSNLRETLDPQYEGGRIFIWTNSARIITSNPVFGVGQGNFRDVYAENLRKDIPDFRKQVHAHNDFINIAAIGGLPAALFFIGIWVLLFGYMRRIWRSSSHTPGLKPLLAAAMTGATVFVVTSLTEATFADEEVRQMLMFVWAVGLFFACPRK
jgi:O-antigen ligase